MTFRNTLKELFRTPWRTLMFLLLLALSAALLTVGLNLYAGCVQARREVSAQYQTVGFVRQMPDSTKTVTLPGYGPDSPPLVYDQPEFTTAVPEDLFDGLPAKLPVENRPSVMTTALRENGELLQMPYRLSTDLVVTFIPNEDVDGADEAFLESHPSYSGAFEFSATLTSAFGEPVKEEEAQVRLIWPSSAEELPSRLKAGTEYAASGGYGYNSDGTDSSAIFLYRPGKTVEVRKNRMVSEYLDQIAFETNEAFAATEAAGIFAAKTENSQKIVNGLAHNLCLTVPTNSLSLLEPFYENRVTVKYGRAITQEEFESGAKVCMVPEEFRSNQSYPNAIDVGDKLRLSWYGAVYNYPPAYLSSQINYMENFFQDRPIREEDGGEYEIVGIYASPEAGGGEMELGCYQFVVPARSYGFDSVPILYGGPLQPACCSFQLENGTADQFTAAFNALGYGSLKAEIHDRGYSIVAKGLDAVSLVAVILLLAGGISTLCLLVFFVYLQIARRKREAAIQISLGSGRKKCAAALLLSVMLVALAGISAGTLAGHCASAAVSRQVYGQAASSGYSRDYSDQFESSENLEYEYRGGASPLLSLLSGLTTVAAALLLSSLFTRKTLKAEPLALLSRKETD